MANQRELLEESKDSWIRSARHDKFQFLGSFALTAVGIGLAVVGVKTGLSGDVGGSIIEISAGTGLTGLFGSLGASEIEDFIDSRDQVIAMQRQIDGLAE
jgi:hypothetical protein